MAQLQGAIAPAIAWLTSGHPIPHAERLAAEAMCDRFKNSAEATGVALDFFRALVQQPLPAASVSLASHQQQQQHQWIHDEGVQHFLLQALLVNVRARWDNGFSEEVKTRLKDQALMVLVAYCSRGPAPHLAQKAADVLSDMAKREWPQKWPTFHTQVSGGWVGGGLVGWAAGWLLSVSEWDGESDPMDRIESVDIVVGSSSRET